MENSSIFDAVMLALLTRLEKDVARRNAPQTGSVLDGHGRVFGKYHSPGIDAGWRRISANDGMHYIHSGRTHS
jgi:hypothetical protein